MALEGRRALFISYNGMLEPLGQSQVIPYLKELSREGVIFTLLSFERAAAYSPDGLRSCDQLKRELAASNIEWQWLRYHKRFSLPATFYDVVAGIQRGSNLVGKNKIELVHARSHIPATIAIALKRRFNLKLIFDVRGLMAEEYVDAGNWRERDVRFKLSKQMERRSLAAADGIVTLTERIWPVMTEWEGLRGREVAHQVIPCCADLDLFKFDPDARELRRKDLGVENRFVLTYSGSIGGWYLTGEMVDFFAALLERRPEAHFLWLTTGDRSLIDRLMTERGLGNDRYTIRTASQKEMPSYLSASDAGIALYKPTLSRLATSPVKLSEYLACGLPVIVNKGVGDSDTLVRSEQLGAVLEGFTTNDYQQAAAQLETGSRQRARAVAEKYFDVRTIGRARYAKLYEEVLSSTNG